MIVPLDLLLLVVLVVTAVLALRARDLLTSVVLLASYSLFAALLFTAMGAVDVGLVEGALGAGLTGVLFIAAILVTTNDATERSDRGRRLLVLPFIAGFLGLIVFASTGLPDRGALDAPAQRGVSTEYLERSVEQTQTPNVVTSLLADYRSQDTLGETLVILTAALATALVLARRPDRPEADPRQETSTQDDPEIRHHTSKVTEPGEDRPEDRR